MDLPGGVLVTAVRHRGSGESAEVKWKEQKGLTIATKELKEIKVRERERGG